MKRGVEKLNNEDVYEDYVCHKCYRCSELCNCDDVEEGEDD